MLFCAPIIGLWYWCTDQYIVQRILGARDDKAGKTWYHLRRFFKIHSRFSFYHPGYDMLCIGKKGINADIQQRLIDANGNVNSEPAQGGICIVGDACTSRWCKRYCSCRAACCINECIGRCIQCIIIIVYNGFLFKIQTKCITGKIGKGGKNGHCCYGDHRLTLDTGNTRCKRII